MKNRSYSAARIRSASYNKEDNTIDIIWSTGSDVLRSDELGNEFIERLQMGDSNVRLGRLNAGAPFLDTHSSESLSNVIGSIVPGSARVENGKGLATVKLSAAASDADIVSKIKDGVIRNISVGYLVHASTRTDDDDPPVVTVTNWEPLEISAVPIPADAGAQIRSAQRKRARDRQSPAQRAAAYASRLLRQSTQSAAEAHGATEARRALGTMGRMSNVPLVKKMDKREIERGAIEARKLLKGRQ